MNLIDVVEGLKPMAVDCGFGIELPDHVVTPWIWFEGWS